jgi:hypothetical protein
MPDYFRDMFEAMRETNKGLKLATNGLVQATDGINKMLDATLLARGEHEDLRETIHRLEALIMELIVQKRNESNT